MTVATSLGRRAFLGLGILTLALAAWSAPTAGQEPPEAPAKTAEAGPEVKADDILTALKQLEAAKDIPDDVKKRAQDLYTQALGELKQAGEWAEKAAQYEQQWRTAPDTLRSVREQLAKPEEELPLPVKEGASLADLEAALEAAQSSLSDARTRLSDLESSSRRLSERRQAAPKELEDAKAQLAETTDRLARKAEGQPIAVSQADRVLLRARALELRARIQALERETIGHDRYGELVVAQHDLAARLVSQRERLVKRIQKLVADQRRSEAEKAAERAKARMAALAGVDPVAAQLAEENASLANARTGPQGLPARIESARAGTRDLAGELARLDQDFRTAQDKVRAAGQTNAIGQYLRKKRADIPDIVHYRRQIKLGRREIADVQLRLIELEEQRQQLGDLDGYAAQVISRADPSLSAEKRAAVEQAVRTLLSDRRALLGSLVDDYNAYFAELVDYDTMATQLIAKARAFRDYIDERVLWIRSMPPIRLSIVPRLGEAAAWLLSPAEWAGAGAAALADLQAAPGTWLWMILLLLLLAVLRCRLRKALKALGPLVQDPKSDSMVHTVKGLAITALLAAPLPAACLFLGWRLRSSLEATDFSAGIGTGLSAVGYLMIVIQSVRAACRPGGLAEIHFRWRQAAIRHLRRQLLVFGAALAPAVLIVAMVSARSSEVWQDSLGRAALIAEMLIMALLTARMLQPSGHLIGEILRRREGGWVDRLKYVWYALAIAAPTGMAIVAALGYYYTVVQLAHRFFATIVLVLALVLVDAVLSRWLFVLRRRLALRRAAERQAAAAAGEPAAEPQAPTGAPEAGIYSLSIQSRKVLRLAVAAGLIVGLWLIWSDVLPALGVLKRVELWSVTREVTQKGSMPDGTEQISVTRRLVPVTLADLAFAAIIVLMTLAAVRNVPGLLEIAILQRLPITSGVRFAIAAVSRYILTILGLILAFGTVGLTWSKVQWLAAAVTVGLGFGLQEIFANFVSGLIILFEQPMRVGDTVTVGETSGTVTKIHIRATTILDWDRKELVVPNKEFITGRLINWSLSDPILRVVIRVGIAYGSDTALAERTLLDVARAERHVLTDPAPSVVFRSFGESSLDFELRVFIPSVDVYVATIHRLHMAIDQAFRKAGIEISFPQRDLHIRSIDAVLPLAGRVPGAGEEKGESGQGGGKAGG